jgi:uncharacterized membrane protein
MKHKNGVLAALLVAVPILYLAGMWLSLPPRVPLHFDFNGAIDRYGSKNELLVLVLALSFVSLLVYLLLSYIHRFSKKAPVENKDRMQKIALAVLFFITLVQCWLLYSIQQGALAISIKFILAAVCLLFAVIGNYMPNLKPNYVAGFRLPWTLHNEAIWRKTHFIAGRLWFGGGLVCMLLWLLLPFKMALFLCSLLLLIMLVLPAVYSYRLFKHVK